MNRGGVETFEVEQTMKITIKDLRAVLGLSESFGGATVSVVSK